MECGLKVAGETEILLITLYGFETFKTIAVVPVLAYDLGNFLLYRKKILSKFPDAGLLLFLRERFANNDCGTAYGMIAVYQFPLDFHSCFHKVPPFDNWNHSRLTYIIPHNKRKFNKRRPPTDTVPVRSRRLWLSGILLLRV